MTKMTFEMPDELHHKLKLAAVQQHTTVKALLIGCAEKIVNPPTDRTQDARAPYDANKSESS